MASTGPSGICTVLNGAGASGALGVGASGALAPALALAAAGGWGFAGDLQPHAEVAKAKASID